MCVSEQELEEVEVYARHHSLPHEILQLKSAATPTTADATATKGDQSTTVAGSARAQTGGLAVYSSLPLPRGTSFGPFKARRLDNVDVSLEDGALLTVSSNNNENVNLITIK